jgi:hypothetical protein
MRADDVLEGYALVDRYVFHDGVYKGVDSLALKREWIASLPGKPTPAALFLFQASGDAMAPTITDGDLVLTNTHDQDLRDGGVFVIRPKSMPPNHPFMIRRVRRALPESSNSFVKMTPSITLSSFQFRRIRRLLSSGRVIWSGGFL